MPEVHELLLLFLNQVLLPLRLLFFKPCTRAAFVAVSAAICAAYGVDFLEPLKPRPPALAHDKAFPSASVIVTIVLLKDD